MSAGDVRWNAAHTLERLGGDEQLFHEIIEIFLREAPKQMASMRDALAGGDKDATERIAHTLKGELGYLGVSEASHNASELGSAGRNGDLARAASIQNLLEKDVESVVQAMRGVLARDVNGLVSGQSVSQIIGSELIQVSEATVSIEGMARQQPSALRALVAEDDPMFRRILQSWLEAWGHEVSVVENGALAWNLLQEDKPPELLILDWVMPEIDGTELCRRIREQQRSPYQYILLVTGKNDRQDVVRGLDAGADDYLTKPFDRDELRARLRVGKRILALQDSLIHAREELRFQATHDVLTGLWNRGAVMELLNHELDRSTRANLPTAVLMLDLDHFKKINDTHGHLAGDAVLKEAARRLTRAVRSYDSVGHYGGEEFLIVLPACDRNQTINTAERIRSEIGGTPVFAGAVEISFTVSIGATVAGPGACPPTEVLAAADGALYQAKNTGRDRTVLV